MIFEIYAGHMSQTSMPGMESSDTESGKPLLSYFPLIRFIAIFAF